MMAAEGVSRETQMSIQASSMFPGFRFSPTDVELISYYLKKKLDGYDKCVEVIPEIEICRYEPWDLPAKSIIKSDNEWFFFCARGRKYPNGSQSRRATEQGYWKATGKERNVKSGSNVIGTKRTLVFHTGRAPKGERTEWIMHEYCMKGKSQDSLVVCRLRKNSEFRLNNNSNRVARNHRELSIVHDSNHATSDGGTDLTGISEGDKAIEFYSKKATSSNDSHSIEQIDSASESEQKLSNEVAPTESSTLKKDSDDEEDFFAEILKDDIIRLDETSLSASTPEILPMIATTTHRVSLLQGGANRRIRLTRTKADVIQHGTGGISTKKWKSEGPPKCLLSVFSPRTAILVILITLLALLLPCSNFKSSKVFQIKMSRPMLLVFLFIIIIITSQFEWRQPLVVDVDTTPSVSQKPQQISRREEAVKEKIILSQEKKIQRLNELVRSLEQQLLQCKGDNKTTNGTVSYLTERILELERQQILED
ncbi:NAC domain-containing protein 89-like [Gossypium arboreum]|uniref:NAC domain-containing protein 89-like n=1 Tax=Gossypium arboreum TaxID=29729 RepID=UPI0022F1BE8B|nr:NAC domain-containing protein 89-like [Gossypium arboreum]